MPSPCPLPEGGYWYYPPLKPGTLYSQRVWIPCPTGSSSGSTGSGVGQGSGGNSDDSSTPTGQSMEDFKKEAADWAKRVTDFFLGDDSQQPPSEPGAPWNPPPTKTINKGGNAPVDPCGPWIQTIQDSQLPTGDALDYWSWEMSPYNGTSYGISFSGRAHGLSIENQLADIANDWSDYSDDPDMSGTFEDAVKTITTADTPEDVADQLVNSIFDSLLGAGNYDSVGPGELSPALISVLNQMAQEIQDGNGGDINWSDFGDYLRAQTDTDAVAMQADWLGGGVDPLCPQFNSAANDALMKQRNNQRKANNDLKKLDKNIKPPKLPPAPGGTFKGPVKGPVKITNPFVGVQTTTRNTAMSHLGPINPGKLGPVKFVPGGPQIAIKGPTVDVTYAHHPILPPFTPIGVLGAQAEQAQGLFGGTITPTELPDWAGESAAAQGLIDFMQSTSTKILDVITAILGSFVGTDPDPDYNTKMTVGVGLDGETQVVENKLGVLLAFRKKFPDPPPPSDPTALANYNKLMNQLANLETWYYKQYNEFFGNYP